MKFTPGVRDCSTRTAKVKAEERCVPPLPSPGGRECSSARVGRPRPSCFPGVTGHRDDGDQTGKLRSASFPGHRQKPSDGGAGTFLLSNSPTCETCCRGLARPRPWGLRCAVPFTRTPGPVRFLPRSEFCKSPPNRGRRGGHRVPSSRS